MHFLIESRIWEDNEERIISVLTDKKIPYTTHPFAPFDPSILNTIDDPNIFCYGSLQWIAQARTIHDLRLNIMCSIYNFDCQVYYPYFEDFLFNDTYQMMTLCDFVSNFKNLLDQYEGKLFLRPCTGYKNGPISGGIFDQHTFDKYIYFFKDELKKEDMVIVDKVRHIDYEWRTIIHGNRCITGCQYGSFDLETQRYGFDPDPSFPDRVRIKAEEVARAIKWVPDPIFVLDIVESKGELSVMEINALSTSGWYDCDIGAIVDSICLI